MSRFPADEFYRPSPHDELRQGDIVLAPTTLVWDAATRVASPTPPVAPDALGTPAFGPLWTAAANRGAIPIPALTHETRFGPTMVLSHDCEIEKDFNEQVRALEDLGIDREEAIRQASDDPTLDPLVVVAPLLPIETFPARRHTGIRDNVRIGYFSTAPCSALDDREYAVDLMQVSTVDRHLLQHFPPVASLSPIATGVLRFKLAEAYATRDLSVIAELEAAVGQRITGVRTHKRSNKSMDIVLHLDNGEQLHIEGRPLRQALPPEVTRTRGKS